MTYSPPICDTFGHELDSDAHYHKCLGHPTAMGERYAHKERLRQQQADRDATAMTYINGFTPGMKITLRTTANDTYTGEFVGWLPIGLVWKDDTTLTFTPNHRIHRVAERSDD